MAWTLSKKFTFEAAHSLTHLSADHKCHRPHGHSYTVEVCITAEELDHRGFAGLDYTELDAFKEYIDRYFDHRDLNVVMGGGRNTTAECLARHFFNWCKEFWPNISAVRVYETAKTCAEYRE